jgi:C4-type Zn-finger protein
MNTQDKLKRIKSALVQIVHFSDRVEYVLKCEECGLQAMDASIFEAEKLLATHECEGRPAKCSPSA